MSTNAHDVLERTIPQEHRSALALRLAAATTAAVVLTALAAYLLGYTHALRASEAATADGANAPETYDTYVPTTTPSGVEPPELDTLPNPPPAPAR